MLLFVHLLLFTTGLVFLGLSSDILVKSCGRLARVFRISTFFVGLILLAFGTSLPEGAVSIVAALKNESAIALGNILGSNIANIGLVLGFASLILPVKTDRDIFKAEVPAMVSATLAFVLLSWDGVLSRGDGAIFLAGFIVFCLVSYRKGRGRADTESHMAFEGFVSKIQSKAGVLGVFGVSLLVLIASAQLMVTSGIRVAEHFGVDTWLIALTLFAIGTSLPELAVCVSASLRKSSEISIGNVIGSNIFNILFILGVAALIRPIPVHTGAFRFEFPALLIFSAAMVVFMRTRWQLSRIEAGILFAGYLGFVLCLVKN